MSNILNITGNELTGKTLLINGEKDTGTTIIKFGAKWCGPCQMLDSSLLQYTEAQSDIKVGIVDVDDSPDLAAMFRIMSVPMTFFFKDGELVTTIQPIVGPNMNQIKEIAESL